MKIGILTNFGSWNPGYALHVNWLQKARMLEYFGQDFDFLVSEKCSTDIYPRVKKNIISVSSALEFTEKVTLFTNCFKDILKDYDLVLAPDLIYQLKGDFLPINQAIRNVIPALKCKWLFWVHSGYVEPDPHADYPQTLRYSLPPRSKLVYQNSCEAEGLARMYQTTLDNVRVVPVTKDYRDFNDFDPLSWKISRDLGMMEKEFVQVLPFCSTRMDAKGLDIVIKTFASLKKQGRSVALVLANSHASQVQGELIKKKALLDRLGMVNNRDYVFTSSLTDNKPLSRKCVSDLFKLTNLFIFASFRENCPNVLLEAKINGNLLVLNSNTRPLHEFGGNNAIYFQSDAKRPGVPDRHPRDMVIVPACHTQEFFDALATRIIKAMDTQGTIYKSRREGLAQFSNEYVWNRYMKPVLYEGFEEKREVVNG